MGTNSPEGSKGKRADIFVYVLIDWQLFSFADRTFFLQRKKRRDRFSFQEK